MKSGLSQLGLASKLGVSRPTIASIEAGRQAVTVEQLVDICVHVDANAADVVKEALGGPAPSSNEFEKLPAGQRSWILKLKKSKGAL
jgi:DNA-binding XRE family transcriptional regulator